MKKISTLIMVTILGLTFTSSNLMAEPAKGQKIYLKKLKKSCGISGLDIANKHTQDEWEDLKYEDKIEEEIKNICPNVKDVKDKYIPHLFDFFYEYASDSGNVPSCS